MLDSSKRRLTGACPITLTIGRAAVEHPAHNLLELGGRRLGEPIISVPVVVRDAIADDATAPNVAHDAAAIGGASVPLDRHDRAVRSHGLNDTDVADAVDAVAWPVEEYHIAGPWRAS